MKTAFLMFTLSALATPVWAKPKAAKRKAVVSSVHVIARDASLKSVQGQDIVVVRVPAIKNGKPVKAKHQFYIQGGLHGNEKLTSTFVAWLASQVMKGKSLLNQLPTDQVAFDFVPIANPDGHRNSQRTNKNLINLNRNFGVLWGKSKENPGKTSFSEPETRAIRYLVKSQKYTAAVDVHGYVDWVVAPSAPKRLKGGMAKGALRTKYPKWIKSLKQSLPQLGEDYQLKTAAGLGDGGAFEDWAFWDAGAFAFCLEMSSAFRYQYRPDKNLNVKKIDRFRIYERYMYTMFKRAIDLSSESIQLSEHSGDGSATTKGTHPRPSH